MEDEIELRELFDILIKRKWIIVIIVAITVLIGSLYSLFFVKPMYKSDTTLMVNNSKGVNASDLVSSFDIGSLNLSQKLVVTYGEIVKSRIVLDQVIKKEGLEITYEQLLRKIISSPVGSTEILKISVQDVNPNKASEIANTISDVFIKEVMRILKVNNVEIIDRAIPVDQPINIKTKLNIAISFVLGLMMAVFICFAMEYLDNSIKTPQDIEKHLDLPVLGMIPDFNHVESKKGRKKHDK